MAKAKKLASGNWRCLAYIGMENGKRKYKSFTAPTKKEAELMALSYEQDKEKQKSTSATLGAIADRYIDLKTNILSASTIREYRRIRNSHYPELFAMNVDDITSPVLQAFINEEAAHNAAKTVKNRFGFILSALKEYAPEKHYNIKYPPRQKRDVQIPTDEDVKRLWEYTKGTEMEVPILLAAYAGMRRGEICAVESVKGNRVVVDKVMALNDAGAWIIQARAKTEAGNRTVYVPSFVASIIKKAELPVTINPNAISDRFRGITKALGMPDYRFHDLRHYYASVLMSAGVPDKYVIERIGHSTDHMLKTVYQHTMKEKNKEIDATIDTLFKP